MLIINTHWTDQRWTAPSTRTCTFWDVLLYRGETHVEVTEGDPGKVSGLLPASSVNQIGEDVPSPEGVIRAEESIEDDILEKNIHDVEKLCETVQHDQEDAALTDLGMPTGR